MGGLFITRGGGKLCQALWLQCAHSLIHLYIFGLFCRRNVKEGLQDTRSV